MVILLIWESKFGCPACPEVSPVAQASCVPVMPLNTTTAENGKLQIRAVFGVGNQSLEYVLITNPGEKINLSAWQLRDGQGHVYIFPALSLNPGGEVKLFTRPGTDSVTELHWGFDMALWASGDEVQLYTAQGELNTNYLIP